MLAGEIAEAQQLLVIEIVADENCFGRFGNRPYESDH
jgi:hypothetical protein